MSSSSSKSSSLESTAVTSLTDLSWDSSSVTPSFKRPAYTVINEIAPLQELLDCLVEHVRLPPKLYSRADSAPRSRTRYSAAPLQGEVLCEATIAPPRLFDIPKTVPELYIDAEGISLSRDGELSILILHIETATLIHTYLIHVHILKESAFTITSSDGLHTLGTILKDNRVPKVLFDAKMDSDALYGRYGILMGGVIDLQLMRLASRKGGGPQLPGPEMCLNQDLEMSAEERTLVSQAKACGQKLWRPRCGGSMERFNDSPLLQGIIDYCVVDAAYLPRLYEVYNRALGDKVWVMAVDNLWGQEDNEALDEGVFSWECRVLHDSRARVRLALEPRSIGGTSRNPWHRYHMYSWMENC